MEIYKRTFAKLHLFDQSKSSYRIVLISSLLIGYTLGVFVYPTWTDNVESAQVLAGNVNYDSPANPMYIYHSSIYSLLIQGGALLLRAGFSEWETSVFFSGLEAAISFSALALCTFVFSRNSLISLLTPFIVLRLAQSPSATAPAYIANLHGHNYPILFPVHASLYGVIGLFLTLLLISLIALEKNSVGGFLLGLMPAIHPTLSILCWLAVSLGLVLEYKAQVVQLKPALKFFGFGFAIFLLTFAWHQISQQDNTPLVALPSAATQFSEYFLLYWDNHNALIPLQILPSFFEVDFYLLVIASSYLLAFPQPFFRPGRFIAKSLIGTTSIATVYILFQNTFPALLPININGFLHGLLISRWLNLNSVALPALLIGLLSWLALQHRDLIALLVLAFIALATVSNNLLSLSISSALPYLFLQKTYSPPESVPFLSILIKSALFPFTAIVTSYLALKSTRPNFLNTTYPERWVKTLNPIFSTLVILPLIGMSFSPLNTPHSNTNSNSAVLDRAKNIQGPILYAPVWGIYRIQTRTRRPVLLDLTQINLISYVPQTAPTIENILNKVYNLSLQNPQGYQSYYDIATTWSKRTLQEWQTIRKDFGVTSIIAPASYNLQLPLLEKTEDLVLYDIPLPSGW